MYQPEQQKSHPQKHATVRPKTPDNSQKERNKAHWQRQHTEKRGVATYVTQSSPGFIAPTTQRVSTQLETGLKPHCDRPPVAGHSKLAHGRQSCLVAPGEGHSVWHHLRTWLEGCKRRGTLSPVLGPGWSAPVQQA